MIYMRGVSALEISVITNGLNGFIGYRIDQFYEIDTNKFRMKLKGKENVVNLICSLPYTINKTEYMEKNEETTAFSSQVRKLIDNSIIKEISQLDNDRIIIFSLEKSNKFNIIVELFGKGNFVITDDKMKVLLAYNKQISKDRVVKINERYIPPVTHIAKNLDDIISDIKKNPDSTIISAILKEFGIGSLYLENILINLGIDPKAKIFTIDEKIGDIVKEVDTEIKKAKSSKNAIVYYKDNNPIDYSVVEIKKYSGLDKKEFSGIQEALDAVYIFERMQESKKSELNPEIEKIEISIKKQKNLAIELEDEIRKNKSIGEKIFMQMPYINHIIKELRENKHISKDALQEISPEIKIISIDLKEKVVVIDI